MWCAVAVTPHSELSEDDVGSAPVRSTATASGSSAMMINAAEYMALHAALAFGAWSER